MPKTTKLIAASTYPSGGNAQFGSDPSKANRLLGVAQVAAAGRNGAAGKAGSGKNLNNLLADDGDDGKDTQGEQPSFIQQLLNFFFSKLWSPATSDAEKLGWTYVYAEDGSLLAEYGEGSAATSGSAQYLWLPTANGPMPIAAVVNGQTYAVHSDHLNTPRKLTQANGQAVWQWAYSAFGDEQPTTAAKRFTSEMTVPATGATSIPDVTFNLRYPGQYFDKETGLHYNYFRTYAPGTGRYTQADPIGLDGGFNRFGYVEGNPLIFVDPLGLQSGQSKPFDFSKVCKPMSLPTSPSNECKTEAECWEKARKGIQDCNAKYWGPWNSGKKMACLQCWQYFETQCPGFSPTE